MKKKLLYGVLGAILLGTASCSSEMEEIKESPKAEATTPAEGQTFLKITSAMVEDATRYTDLTRKTGFSEGDIIGVCVLDENGDPYYERGSIYGELTIGLAAEYVRGKWVLNRSVGDFEPVPLPLDPERPAYVMAYWPGRESTNYNPTLNQGTIDLLGYETGNYDILRSRYVRVPENGEVSLYFRHVAGRFQLYAENHHVDTLDGTISTITNVRFFSNIQVQGESGNWTNLDEPGLAPVDELPYIRSLNDEYLGSSDYGYLYQNNLHRVNGSASSTFDGYAYVIDRSAEGERAVFNLEIETADGKVFKLNEVPVESWIPGHEYIYRVTIGGTQENNRPATRSEEGNRHVVELNIPVEAK